LNEILVLVVQVRQGFGNSHFLLLKLDGVEFFLEGLSLFVAFTAKRSGWVDRFAAQCGCRCCLLRFDCTIYFVLVFGFDVFGILDFDIVDPMLALYSWRCGR